MSHAEVVMQTVYMMTVINTALLAKPMYTVMAQKQLIYRKYQLNINTNKEFQIGYFKKIL